MQSDQNLRWKHFGARDATLKFMQKMKTDQAARMCRLICVFVGCTCQKVCFLILRLIWYRNNSNIGTDRLEHSVHPDQMLQNAVSDQCLHHLPLIQHYFRKISRL